MNERLTWPADAELTGLLRRYYGGEAELWPAIQAHVHAELRARGAPVAPRHLRFRLAGEGYMVIVEGADEYLTSP